MRCPYRSAFFLLFLFFGLFSGCQQGSSKKAVSPPDVTVVQPMQKEVTRYLEYTGTTAAIQAVDIRARVSGFLDKILFQPRNKVKAGQVLFVIDPRPYEASVKEASAKLVAQKAQAKLAQTELQISQQLETKEAISSLRLEKKARERDVALAEVELAEANLDKVKLNLEWSHVTSPIDGRVSRNLVDAGNLVGATDKTLLTTVVNDESVYAYFNPSETDLLRVRRKGGGTNDPDTQLPRELPVYLGLADETGYPHKGYIDFADTKVDSSTGTIQIRGVFPNPDGMLMAGMFVKIRIPVEKGMTLLIPDVAVQFDQGGRFVLIVDEQNVVQRKAIKIAEEIDQMRIVEDGLSPKDRVIVYGVQRARPGYKVNPQPSSAPEPQTATEPKNKDGKETGDRP